MMKKPDRLDKWEIANNALWFALVIGYGLATLYFWHQKNLPPPPAPPGLDGMFHGLFHGLADSIAFILFRNGFIALVLLTIIWVWMERSSKRAREESARRFEEELRKIREEAYR